MESGKNWFDKHYKKMLIIPAVLLIFSVVYLGIFIQDNGDIIKKDVSLTGGTTVTVFDKNTDLDDLRDSLEVDFPDSIVRGISNIRTGGQQAFFVETSAEPDEIKSFLADYLGYALDSENSSVEFSGSSLSEGFYQQLRTAIIFAFVFMALIVFIVFRSFVPSIAVIFSAFADIVMTLAVVNLLGMTLSSAGIIAFLMLIGYSVDTDILLTSRILKKKEGYVNERMFGAFKTGLTMTLTSVVVFGIALFVIYSFSDALRQIFSILLIGLGFDIMNTWLGNAPILKWYADSRGME